MTEFREGEYPPSFSHGDREAEAPVKTGRYVLNAGSLLVHSNAVLKSHQVHKTLSVLKINYKPRKAVKMLF